MVSMVDMTMGLLLGVSTFLLVLSFVSYRRSGVFHVRLFSEGLLVHVLFTALLILLSYSTEWLESIDDPVIVIVDALVLAAVLFLGFFGGRLGGRSP